MSHEGSKVRLPLSSFSLAAGVANCARESPQACVGRSLAFAPIEIRLIGTAGTCGSARATDRRCRTPRFQCRSRVGSGRSRLRHSSVAAQAKKAALRCDMRRFPGQNDHPLSAGASRGHATADNRPPNLGDSKEIGPNANRDGQTPALGRQCEYEVAPADFRRDGPAGSGQLASIPGVTRFRPQ